jgi:hypothetical protein
MDAQHLDFEGGGFDGAFLCWILEHVQAKSIEDDLVKQMDEEFRQVEAAPNAVFFYAFVQAAAQVG